MCGRFALAVEKHVLEMLFQLELRGEFSFRYNIAPAQEILAVRISPQHGGREAVMLKWGLVPHWARDESIGARLINARSETAAEKPVFREAFKQRRILIPASGFYEWKTEPAGKQPYFIGMKGGRPFALAGLWESRRRESGQLESCTVLTTAPNSLVAQMHNRMPVIVPEEAYAAWLDPQSGRAALEALAAAPYPEDLMTARPVSRLVNSPANDHPGLIAPLE
ncbi:MAG: SOS response-associated peptidase [Bacillota bacterium]